MSQESTEHYPLGSHMRTVHVLFTVLSTAEAVMAEVAAVELVIGRLTLLNMVLTLGAP